MSTREKIKEILLAALGFVIYVLILSVTYQIPGMFFGESLLSTCLATAVPVFVAGIVIYIFFCTKELKIKSENFTPVKVICVIFISLGMAVILNVLLSDKFIPWDKIPGDFVYPAESNVTTIPLFVSLIAYGVGAPFGEEMLFRALIFNKFNKVMPSMVAMLLSAFMFGFYHGNLIQGIYAFLMGFLFAFLYQKSGSFLAPFLAHSAANILICLASYFNVVADTIYSAAGIIISVLAVILCLFIFVRKTERKKHD